MVTGNAMGNGYWTDISCGVDQTQSYATSACSSRGSDQVTYNVASGNSLSINHLSIQEEDNESLVVDGL